MLFIGHPNRFEYAQFNIRTQARPHFFARDMKFTAIASVAASSLVAANDPSPTWISWVGWKATNANDVITRMTAKTIAQGKPENPGATTSIWFGTQTHDGSGALLQPILPAIGQTPPSYERWAIFSEVFDWTNEMDHQSNHVYVNAGDVLVGEIRLVDAAQRTYRVSAQIENRSSTLSALNYTLLPQQTDPEQAAYFVIEHSVPDCSYLPASGGQPFFDIELEVNGKVVENVISQFSASMSNPNDGNCNCEWVTDAENGFINVTWGN